MPVKALQSVTTALTALEVIAARQPVGVSSLASAMDITKSAAQRILTTLAESGWIGPAAGARGSWVLTSKAMVVGSHFVRSDLRDRMLPVMTRVRTAVAETVFLAVRDGSDVVYVAVLESPQPVKVSFPVGTAQPAVHTAAGAVLVHDMDEDARRDVFGDDALDPGFVRRLGEVRAHGFALNLGEDVPEYHNVAAPVRDAAGSIVAALGVSAPADRMTEAVGRRIGGLVVEALTSLEM